MCAAMPFSFLGFVFYEFRLSSSSASPRQAIQPHRLNPSIMPVKEGQWLCQSSSCLLVENVSHAPTDSLHLCLLRALSLLMHWSVWTGKQIMSSKSCPEHIFCFLLFHQWWLGSLPQYQQFLVVGIFMVRDLSLENFGGQNIWSSSLYMSQE